MKRAVVGVALLLVLVPPLIAGEIHVAASRGDVAALERMLAADPALVEARETRGLVARMATPLHFAADAGQEEAVVVLLSKGADPNARDDLGGTPLHLAAQPVNPERLLSASPQFGALAQQWADTIRKGQAPQVDSSVASMEAMRKALAAAALPPASMQARARIVSALASKGADVNAQNSGGQTPLHVAAVSQTGEIVEALLKARADPRVRDREGNMPVHLAASCGSGMVVGLLLDRGALVDATGAYEATPLNDAARSGNVETIRELLAHGASVTAQDREGSSPLQSAAEKEDASPTRRLLAAGADVNATSKDGRTPFTWLRS